MTTRRIYICNFCRSEYPNVDSLHGLHWSGTSLEKRPARICENHLCDTCLVAITEVGNQSKPDPPSTQVNLRND